MKRVAAERAASCRSLFKLEPLPPPGEAVPILVVEEDGRTSQLEAVHWPHLGWTDAVTLLRIEDDVLGWRKHPFASEPLNPIDDSTTWSRGRLDAELANLTRDPACPLDDDGFKPRSEQDRKPPAGPRRPDRRE